MSENLWTAIIAGHGDPLEVAICRVIMGALFAAPVVMLLAAAIQAMWPRPRRQAWRYDRITDPRRPRR